MADLSDDALAIRTGIFLNPRTTLTMHNEESVFTDRAAAAMKELVDGGYVLAEPKGQAVTYSLQGAGFDLPRKSMAWMDKHGKFPLARKKEASNG